MRSGPQTRSKRTLQAMDTTQEGGSLVTRRNLLIFAAGLAAVGIAGTGAGYYFFGPQPTTAAPQPAPGAEVSSADLLTPGPLGDMALGRRQGAGDDHRICLDDLPALRPVPRDHLSGAQEALHRHRQGPLHLPRIPARSAGGRRLHAGALRRQGQILPDDRDAVRAAEGMGGRRSRCSRCWRSPSRPASPSRASTSAWRIRRCSTASRRCASGRSRSSASSPPRRSSSTARSCAARCTIESSSKADRALSQGLIRVFSVPQSSDGARHGRRGGAGAARFRLRNQASDYLRSVAESPPSIHSARPMRFVDSPARPTPMGPSAI